MKLRLHRYRLLSVYFIMFLVALFLHMLVNIDVDYEYAWAEWIGGAFGLVFLPSLLLAVPNGIAYLFTKRFSAKYYTIQVSILYSIFIAFWFVGVTYDPESPNVHAQFRDGSSQGYVFSEGEEFEVTFPKRPRFYENKVESLDGVLRTIQGGDYEEGDILLRAEIGMIPEGFEHLNESEAYSAMRTLSRDMGLERPKYVLRNSGGVQVLNFYGTRYFDDKNMFVEVVNLHGTTSVLTLTLLSPPDESRNSLIKNFTKSVTYNGKKITVWGED